MGWPFNTRRAAASAPGPNPSLPAQYDGLRSRSKRHMVVLLPSSQWGGKPYGLGAGDDFRFEPPEPVEGGSITLHIGDGTLGRLIRQRDLRATHRRRRRR